MNYPYGWSFWTPEEWRALKNKRTDHYYKLKVQEIHDLQLKKDFKFAIKNQKHVRTILDGNNHKNSTIL